jgi:hypothetical protein
MRDANMLALTKASPTTGHRQVGVLKVLSDALIHAYKNFLFNINSLDEIPQNLQLSYNVFTLRFGVYFTTRASPRITSAGLIHLILRFQIDTSLRGS